MQTAEALLEIIHERGKSAVTATTESITDFRSGRLCGMRHWRATCGESRMRRSVGGRRKRVRVRGNLAGGLPCGASKSAARTMECLEGAGEYWRRGVAGS